MGERGPRRGGVRAGLGAGLGEKKGLGIGKTPVGAGWGIVLEKLTLAIKNGEKRAVKSV